MDGKRPTAYPAPASVFFGYFAMKGLLAEVCRQSDSRIRIEYLFDNPGLCKY